MTTSEWSTARHRTAITRVALSVPVRQALADGVLTRDRIVLDYGAGRGLDVRRLAGMGFNATGWDPYFDHGTSRVEPSSVVMLLYVLNVIERASERATTLKAAWDLTKGTLVVSARLTWDARRITGEDLEDGVLTSRGTSSICIRRRNSGRSFKR